MLCGETIKGKTDRRKLTSLTSTSMTIFRHILQKGSINKLLKETDDIVKQHYLNYLIFQKKKLF